MVVGGCMEKKEREEEQKMNAARWAGQEMEQC